ncbi:hypothetical protein [Sorangium sp. So ce385]|uniref:hypothetical protein n=1 Tax=Sorangium sp. So ce385 TaxID=3133308 RepID=UPI003F5CB3F6
MASTVGSSFEGGDELRFDKETLLLSSLLFTLPDGLLEDDNTTRAWLAAPRREGLPRLMEPAVFNLNPTEARAASNERCDALVCVSDRGRLVAEPLRLTIAQDLDLLFSCGRYCGWLLTAPVDHLGLADAGEASSGRDAAARLLSEYLNLVSEANIERMNEGDERLRRALIDLLTRCQDSLPSAPRVSAIARQVSDILDRFYGSGEAG